jgi:hypothetical protein
MLMKSACLLLGVGSAEAVLKKTFNAISLMRIAVQHGKPIVVHRARTNAPAEAAELPIGMIPL